MSFNLQSSVRDCTPDVRTKWINFKFSNFLPWQNLMQVSCYAIRVLSMNVLDLQNLIMSNAWWRSGKLTVFFYFSNLVLAGIIFVIITFCVYLNIGVQGVLSQYTEIINFIFHVSVCITLLHVRLFSVIIAFCIYLNVGVHSAIEIINFMFLSPSISLFLA